MSKPTSNTLTKLPVGEDGTPDTGYYRMRNGQVATIVEIGCFLYGYTHERVDAKRGDSTLDALQLWNMDGAYTNTGEHPFDLVAHVAV